jgi:hypothetical protein
VVRGWFTTGLRAADAHDADTKVRACARAAGGLDGIYGVGALYNADVGTLDGVLGIGNRPFTLEDGTVLGGAFQLEPAGFSLTVIAHEMGHGYGLGHSWAASSCGCGGAPGEYCDAADVMSGTAAWTFHGVLCPPTGLLSSYCDSGPGLIAPYRAQLGWLPTSRITRVTHGQVAEVPLISLDHSQVDGPLLIEVPLDDGSRYTVELHHRVDWDRALPQDAALIHRVDSSGRATAMIKPPDECGANLRTLFVAGERYQDPATNVTIEVERIDDTTATVRIAR